MHPKARAEARPAQVALVHRFRWHNFMFLLCSNIAIGPAWCKTRLPQRPAGGSSSPLPGPAAEQKFAHLLKIGRLIGRWRAAETKQPVAVDVDRAKLQQQVEEA